MSRFKPSPYSRIVSPEISFPASGQEITPVVTAPEAAPQTAHAAAAASDFVAPATGDLDKLGFICLCIYMLSGSVNDWTIRLLGVKAYLSIIMLFATPAIYLISRNRFRALHHNMGRWWAAFVILLLVDAPFSIWRGGTFDLLVNYVPRSYVLFFFITAFVTNLRRCRMFLLINIACSIIMMATAVKFGTYDEEGRFRIVGSLFASNSNDLALGLLLGITQIGFLLRGRGMLKKAVGATLIAISFIYLFRTGSRGCLLAAFVYGLLVFFFTRNKVLVLAFAVCAAAVVIMANPSAAFQRLKTFDDVTTSAGASTQQRKELFWRSVHETVTHPLVGVGPGQFPVAVAGESERRGERPPWLGTHNSYTQVSSECGVPALVCYCAVIFLCFRLNYRMFLVARENPLHTDIAGISFTLLSGIVVYSTATFFFHMAYTGNLPILAGLTLSLYFSSRSVLKLASPKSTQAPVSPYAAMRSAV